VRVIDPTEIPRTAGTGTEAVPTSCQEKLRLRMQFAAEARRFLAQLQRKSTADEARKACEQAMDALEAHRMTHGC
jgi:hypothetical protein